MLTNLQGQLVKTLSSKKYLQAGLVQVQTDLRELPQGIYFVQLKTAGGIITEKLVKQ